jgi:UDP-glucose-4-epimerase GalE
MFVAMRVLVTGGAGYIGSHVVRALLEAEHEVRVVDDLSTGHRALVERNGVPLHLGDCGDRAVLDAALPGCDAVVHVAGKALVPESVRDPGPYFRVNCEAGRAILEAMRAHGVRRLVFSSTCAVYGLPDALPITEETPRRPISPYGASKLAFEHVLEAYAAAHGIAALALRYFNVAGAHPKGDLGELHHPETHLIPNVLRAVRTGEPLDLFGTDYPTRDGTAERDYIHVEDLARAHALALARLDDLGPPAARPYGIALNLGIGRGATVLEVLRAVEEVTGRPVPRREQPRRPGDPPALVADPRRAREVLGFQTRHDLRAMVHSALGFVEHHGEGGTWPPRTT